MDVPEMEQRIVQLEEQVRALLHWKAEKQAALASSLNQMLGKERFNPDMTEKGSAR